MLSPSTLITLTYYRMAATNADRVYEPFNAEPAHPHNWTLPAVAGP